MSKYSPFWTCMMPVAMLIGLYVGLAIVKMMGIY